MPKKVPKLDDPERFMDIERMAAYSSFSVQSLYRRISNRTIPHIRVGRRVLFDKAKIDRWLERQSINSKESR